MTDVALLFSDNALSADIAMANGDLVTDHGLRTAVILSLFTDAPARPDDVLPQDGGDRRGWWGDCANGDANDRIGSRLWLLEREKVSETVATRARDYAREALAWMIAVALARSIDISSRLVRSATGSGALGLHVVLTRPDGSALRVDYLWDATAKSLKAATP